MHRVVSREQWIAERQKLLAEEKEFTRRRDALAGEAPRPALGEVEQTLRIRFRRRAASRSSDLFRDRSQLFVQHVMQGPGPAAAMRGLRAGRRSPRKHLLPHLENHDVSVVAIARATHAGTDVRCANAWAGAFRSIRRSARTFNYDYGVSFKPEDMAPGPRVLQLRLLRSGHRGHLRQQRVLPGRVRGHLPHLLELLARRRRLPGIYRILEVTPKGRNEHGPHSSMTDWVRPHNMYGKGGEVAPNGRFTPPVSCCM